MKILWWFILLLIASGLIYYGWKKAPKIDEGSFKKPSWWKSRK